MDVAADFARAALTQIVGRIAPVCTCVTVAGCDDAQVHVASGIKHSVAVTGIADLCALQVDVAAGSGCEGAIGAGDIQAGDPIQIGSGSAGRAVAQGVFSAAVRGAVDVDVAASVHGKAAVGMHAAADVVDVGFSGELDGIGLYLATDIIDFFSGDAHDGTACDCAAVVQFAVQMQVNLVGCDQAAVSVQVAVTRHQINFRYQYFLHTGRLSILAWNTDGLLHQPHHVGGQLRDLLCGQANARAQLPGFGVADAAIHQGGVLCFVAGVAFQKTAACELSDLFAHEFLFDEAIAQTFLHDGRIAGHFLQHVL